MFDFESLRNRFEARLGLTDLVSSARADGVGTLPVRLARFPDSPANRAVTCVSLGLSARPVAGADGHTTRQELLFCCWRHQLVEHVYARLFDLCRWIFDEAQALEYGELLELDCPLFEGATIEGFAPFAPLYHADALGDADTIIAPDIDVVWLVPITAAEAAFIADRGWPAFDELLDRHDPDLLDLSRPSVQGVGGLTT